MTLDSNLQSAFTAVGTAIKGKISSTEKGVANGIATLDGTGKLTASQLPASVIGGLSYQGVWDASANNPVLPAASSSNKGWYYKVSVAGSTTINGIDDWKGGDWVTSNGSSWDKIDNTESISSVAGRTGAIVLGVSDITNLQASLDAKATVTAVNTLSTNIGATDTNYVAVFNAALV